MACIAEVGCGRYSIEIDLSRTECKEKVKMRSNWLHKRKKKALNNSSESKS
jgi:hypothetical protein